VKDPYGLYAWYRDCFYRDSLGDALFEWVRIFGLLAYCQGKYSSIRDCHGMSFMACHKKTQKYCNHPLCPSCWHRRNIELLKALHALKDRTTYIRSTCHQKWTTDLHPNLIKRFKARATRYQLVGYTLSYDACDVKITGDIRRGDPFGGELSYQLVGVFQSDSPVRDKDVRSGQVHVENEGQVVGVIDRREIDPRAAPSEWLSSLVHPWVYRRHNIFEKYLTNFQPRGLSRGWTRINRCRLDSTILAQLEQQEGLNVRQKEEQESSQEEAPEGETEDT